MQKKQIIRLNPQLPVIIGGKRLIDFLFNSTSLMELLAMLYDSFPDQISNWPIPEAKLDDDDLNTSFPFEIAQNLNLLLQKINSSDEAKEFPFSILSVLSGGELNLNELRNLYKADEADLLKSRVVEFDPTLAQMAINEVAADDVLNAFVLCHTHPSLPAEETQDTIAAQLGDEIKQTYKIKPPGLNLSAQDLYQLVTVHEQLKDKMTVYLGVLMFDGKLVLVRIKDNKFVKTEIKIPVNNDTSVQADSN